jgi:serum/glucocorticoid-regulated kinase 2
MGCDCFKRSKPISLLDLNATSERTNSGFATSLLPPQLKVTKKDFEELKLLGKGSYGKVLLVRKRDSQKLFAMKVLEKSLVKNEGQEEHTIVERFLLEKIDHPFIVNLQFSFQTKERLYLITEFMQGGDYFYLLRRNVKFSEDMMKFYMCEIILALEYLHSHNCIYRDLKPENILLDKDGHIRITDLGLSKYFYRKEEANKIAYTICGTKDYLAPEVQNPGKEGYDRSIDWWSLGVLIYESLTGYSPFKTENNNFYNFENYLEDLRIDDFFYWSKEVRDLIKSLLQLNPKNRLGYNGCSDLKEHPFFADVDWEDVINKRLDPPYKPYLSSDMDLSHFERTFTEQSIDFINTESYKDEENKYEGFTYVKPSSFKN